MLHIMAVVQLRHRTVGRAYYDRKVPGRQDLDGSIAGVEAAPVGCRLRLHGR
ncbi:hypothetical protein [Nocardia sp. NPDC059239]|uniref:hypothetical protein n=1 Tax=unclassified Nocardia TaxID=2637762 RepID=UPI0036BFE7A9